MESESSQTPDISKTHSSKDLKEIRFHEKYLQCGLAACPITHGNRFQLDMVVPGLVEQSEFVLYPFEIQPLIIPEEIVVNGGGYVAVSTGEAEERETSRLATLAEIIATGRTNIFIVRGLRRIRFRQLSESEGKVVAEIYDRDPPIPEFKSAASHFLRKLEQEESTEDAFITASRKLPLSEDLRLKFFAWDDKLERRLLLRCFEKQRGDKCLYCRNCWETTGDLTVICEDSSRLKATKTCLNPSGYLFHLALYNDQPDSSFRYVVTYGPQYREHSWFKGYSWSFATCIICRSMLGWKFRPLSMHPFTEISNRVPFWGFRSTEFINSHPIQRQFFLE